MCEQTPLLIITFKRVIQYDKDSLITATALWGRQEGSHHAQQTQARVVSLTHEDRGSISWILAWNGHKPGR